MAHALSTGQIVSFRYPCLCGPPELRRVQVLTVTEAEFSGFDLDRQDDRAFRFELVEDLEVCDTETNTHRVVWVNEDGDVIEAISLPMPLVFAQNTVDLANRYLRSAGEEFRDNPRWLKAVAAGDDDQPPADDNSPPFVYQTVAAWIAETRGMLDAIESKGGAV